jgi:hypothetical protein
MWVGDTVSHRKGRTNEGYSRKKRRGKYVDLRVRKNYKQKDDELHNEELDNLCPSLNIVSAVVHQVE